MKSTFFEDITYLADFFENPNNLIMRNFYIEVKEEGEPLEELRNIFQKGIELALCNF